MDDMEFHREVYDGLHKIIDIAKYILACDLIKVGREKHQEEKPTLQIYFIYTLDSQKKDANIKMEVL